MTDILFVSGATPSGGHHAKYSYPWHRLAESLLDMNLSVKVLAPVSLTSARAVSRNLLGDSPLSAQYREEPLLRGLIPSWRKVGRVDTMFAARRLYRRRMARVCREARLLHFPRVLDFMFASKLLGDGLYDMKYTITPRSSCLLLRDRMGADTWDRMYRCATAVVYPSESVRANAMDISAQYNGRVINHGIADTWYTTPLARRQRPRGARMRFVTTCGLAQWKRTDDLIEMVSQLPDTELTVIGEGPYRRELEALAGRSGAARRVAFTGWLSPLQIMDCYAGADVFALLSAGETLGLVFLEALARGLPVIGLKKSGAYGMFPGCLNAAFLPQEHAASDFIGLARQLTSHGFTSCKCGRCSMRYDNAATAHAFAELFRGILKGGS